MPPTASVVFLIDVDNTLLDNDRVIADLRLHLTEAFGPERQERYWAIFEELRQEKTQEQGEQAAEESPQGAADQALKQFPEGALLLDFHGQATSAGTIYRGTQNGTTVIKLVAKHGPVALTEEASIVGYLATKGIKIEPPNTPPGTPPETRAFGGGYIVRTYGSHTTNGVDAIQLEFGASFRTDAAKREETAKYLAEAIKAYTEKYLARKP